MALFKKGICWTGWVVGCIVSLVFNWFGWTTPPWAEAHRYKAQMGFDSDRALKQSTVFRNHLSEEKSVLILAESPTTQDQKAVIPETPAKSQVSQPKQALKIEQPKQALKVLQPRQALKVQPQQAMKEQPQQAMKIEQSQQLILKLQPQQPYKEQPHQAMKVDQPQQVMKYSPKQAMIKAD